ncbi:hypothetical protein POTOM_015965 [Populus tomentosa]|uniref:Uncharacterized protein n=1 Tax=Populus tomentosa TaxID=118781 RepID=A0A8X8D6L4_POPTO|nr:hypothetical protein POTOM_015965 [Populus tomentosa]
MNAVSIAVDRSHISDNVVVSTPYRDTPRYGMGSETPMHPSRTPLRPYMTPMRDAGATPIHDGMRTPMRDRAWNPYAPMSPPRFDHEFCKYKCFSYLDIYPESSLMNILIDSITFKNFWFHLVLAIPCHGHIYLLIRTVDDTVLLNYNLSKI